MKRLLFLITIILFTGNIFAQYYQHYSQYLANGQAINPAFAGSREVLSTALLYRNQWVGFDGAPKTMTFSAHTPLNKLSSAIGLQLFSDRIGVSKHNFTRTGNYLLHYWAAKHKQHFRDNHELILNKKVLERIHKEIVCVNVKLSPHEQIKKFRLTADEWTPQSGELSPTLKLRRKVLFKKYDHYVKEMFL